MSSWEHSGPNSQSSKDSSPLTRFCCSVTQLWPTLSTPWTAACQASLSFTISRICSNSCPSSWWCHPTISSSVAPFSSCPQSFPASESFPMSWLFASGGQSIGALTDKILFCKFMKLHQLHFFSVLYQDLITLLQYSFCSISFVSST